MDQRCWKAESNGVQMCLRGKAPLYHPEDKWIRSSEWERHTQRRLYAKHGGFITCKFSFWVESFEVRLSSHTDKWDIKHWEHNASRDGKIEPFFLNTFLVSDSESRLCWAASKRFQQPGVVQVFPRKKSSDAEEVTSFCLSTGSDWSLFDPNRANVQLKEPPWLSRHGKGWQPRAETPAPSTKKSKGDATVLNT